MAARFESFHCQAFLRYGFAAMLVSCCVQITMLPLLVVYFHRFSLSGLVLNIGVSAIMAVLIFTGMAGLLTAPLSTIAATPLFELTNLLQWLMVHSVDPFARLGIASVRLPEYSGRSAAVYGMFFVPLMVLAISLPRWNPLAGPHAPVRKFRSRFGNNHGDCPSAASRHCFVSSVQCRQLPGKACVSIFSMWARETQRW